LEERDMKIIITSDTHFGDPKCALVRKNDDRYETYDKFDLFMSNLGDGCDYLVLLGDVFDFSIESYANTYLAAKAFFSAIPEGKIQKAIIYVPGNHDFEFWHWIENEVNIFKQIEGGNSPRSFRWSVPGVFDQRDNANKPGFYLPTVTRRPGDHPYGHLFLDKLTDGQIPFYVAYPNLYFVNDFISILITHGHYLEPYWSLLSEIAPKIFGPDLKVGPFIDLKEMVALNFLTNQLASSGVGQSGPLTERIRYVQRKIKDHEIDAIQKYINNLGEKVLDPFFDYSRFHPKELLTDSGIFMGKRMLKKFLGSIKDTRYSEEFEKKPDVQERFKRFYLASAFEIDFLNDELGYNEPREIPYPKHMIFGHTHIPRPWRDNSFKIMAEGNSIRLHNTGGWLYKKDNETGNYVFVGAEIFVIEDQGISSQSVDGDSDDE
jgi:predicted phosphodiesterase